jgi:GTP-binding protein
MAFVDEITISAKAGNGGNGVVRWLHLKGKEHGGPAGGDGGRGGDVIVRAVHDLNVLYRYRGAPQFKAEKGGDGSSKEMYGKAGKSAIIDVPIGSKITIEETGEEFELLAEGEEVIVLEGGRGGYGNVRFKSSTNQYPVEAVDGRKGKEGTLHIEIQLIADVGIVGLPNAGKSSLLNILTSARSKVGAYPFTTLEPSLGVFHTYILADIPGLIEGASEGKGLGHKFLRHIRRTKVILHCISAEEEEPSRIYEKVRNELIKYDKSLGEKSEIIFLTKKDTVDEQTFLERKKELEAFGEVVPFSILDDELVKNGGDALTAFLRKHG